MWEPLLEPLEDETRDGFRPWTLGLKVTLACMHTYIHTYIHTVTHSLTHTVPCSTHILHTDSGNIHHTHIAAMHPPEL